MNKNVKIDESELAPVGGYYIGVTSEKGVKRVISQVIYKSGRAEYVDEHGDPLEWEVTRDSTGRLIWIDQDNVKWEPNISALFDISSPVGGYYLDVMSEKGVKRAISEVIYKNGRVEYVDEHGDSLGWEVTRDSTGRLIWIDQDNVKWEAKISAYSDYKV